MEGLEKEVPAYKFTVSLSTRRVDKVGQQLETYTSYQITPLVDMPFVSMYCPNRYTTISYADQATGSGVVGLFRRQCFATYRCPIVLSFCT